MTRQTLRPQNPSHGFITRLRQLAVDRSGVGAVEFALIVPLLLSLYITSFELTVGLSISKRITHSASTIADLVTRETGVDKALLATMEPVARSIFTPYAADDLDIKVTGVKIDATGNPTVDLSWSSTDVATYVDGSSVNVPTEMRTPNSFLIHAEVSVSHELLMFMSGITPSEVREFTMSRDFFFRQRLGTSIPCTDCG